MGKNIFWEVSVMKYIVLMLFLVFAVITFGYAGDKDNPPADYKGVVAERPKLTKGDRWDYIRRDKIISYEFTEEKDGNLIFQVWWEDGEKTQEIRTPDLNFIKNFEEECNPYRGVLKFPLWVGKKWSYTYSTTKLSQHGGTGEAALRDSDVKVVSYEQVTVPAGTFWAFKIEEHRVTRGARSPRAIAGYHVTAWYSPEVKNIIKVEEENDVYNRELKKYTVKQER